jgi:hypothetical protein
VYMTCVVLPEIFSSIMVVPGRVGVYPSHMSWRICPQVKCSVILVPRSKGIGLVEY